MSSDVMEYPESINGFFDKYGIWDRDEVYTNGCLLIPVFRVEQMVEHYFDDRLVRCRDCKHYVHSELLGGDACDLQDDVNEYHWLNVEPDGFCAWGERRDE